MVICSCQVAVVRRSAVFVAPPGAAWNSELSTLSLQYSMLHQEVIERFAPEDRSRDASCLGELGEQRELLVIDVHRLELALGFSHIAAILRYM